MEKQYILSIDQSTQGTKTLLFDHEGNLIGRADRPHAQIISDQGWVSHNLDEIYENTLQVIREVIEKNRIPKEKIMGFGISNQRETAAVWEKDTGRSVADAIVWQCSRAKEICGEIEKSGKADIVRQHTGITLSPYFPASKLAWFLRNIPQAKELYDKEKLMLGTIDTWLIYQLTHGKSYKTDYSNASRTQLFNIHTLQWDEEICKMFGLKADALAEVVDSNAEFGWTDLDGYLEKPIPIHGVLGDSHGALFGQGCIRKGMIKATYGTGSSVMMHVGDKPVLSEHGAVTSLAWGIDGKVSYVLEGNINYTGAVITWLQKDLCLIKSASETEGLALAANPEDQTYLVPAFTGLGAPYWDNDAAAIISGLSRVSGKKEVVRAALDSIAYQITDLVRIMQEDSGIEITELRVDGGPTRNKYLMQFQSDMTGISVQVPNAEELSGIGAAYMAGLALKLWNTDIYERIQMTCFLPSLEQEKRDRKYQGWKEAVKKCMSK